MKKTITMILVLLLISVPVFAESFDFSSMTTDELIALKDSVLAELKARFGQTDYTNVIEGSYLVGEDIDAGVYVLFRHINYDYISSVKIYASAEAAEDDNYMLSYSLSRTNEQARVELTDGMYLVVSGNNGVDIRKAEKIIVP